jgi:hypothetical protein
MGSGMWEFRRPIRISAATFTTARLFSRGTALINEFYALVMPSHPLLDVLYSSWQMKYCQSRYTCIIRQEMRVLVPCRRAKKGERRSYSPTKLRGIVFTPCSHYDVSKVFISGPPYIAQALLAVVAVPVKLPHSCSLVSLISC